MSRRCTLTTTITFTTTNFATKQYIQIVAPTDVDTTDDQSTVVLSIYPLLSAPEYALVASENIVVEVADTDILYPSFAFNAASSTVSEAIGSVGVTITLGSASSTIVSIPFNLGVGSLATYGVSDDFTHSPLNTIVFAPGQTVTVITIAILDDTIAEQDETVILQLQGATNAILGPIKSHTLTITNNDSTPTQTRSVAWSGFVTE